MKANDEYRELFAELRKTPDYWASIVATEFTEAIHAELERQEVSRAEFARRLGTSRAYVTSVLGGDDNFTLETMVKLAMAVGLGVHVELNAIVGSQKAAYEALVVGETEGVSPKSEETLPGHAQPRRETRSTYCVTPEAEGTHELATAA